MATRKKLAVGPVPGAATKRNRNVLAFLDRYDGDIKRAAAAVSALNASAGDTDAAIRLLQDFVGTVDAHSEQSWSGPIHWDHARYLADAFEKIVRAAMRSRGWSGVKWNDVDSGEAQPDANLALGISSSKPGRRKGIKTYHTDSLAAAYWYLRRRGFNAENAIASLGAATGADRRTIQRASKAARGFNDFEDETLKHVFEPYAAAMKAILAAARKTR